MMPVCVKCLHGDWVCVWEERGSACARLCDVCMCVCVQAVGSVGAAIFRTVLLPLDTLKTIMQVMSQRC